MANLDKGYGIIAGRSRENAQKAIAAAIAAGLDPVVVRTVAEGYLVPESALREFEKANKAEAKKAEVAVDADADAPKKPARKRAVKTEEAPAESETEKKGE